MKKIFLFVLLFLGVAISCFAQQYTWYVRPIIIKVYTSDDNGKPIVRIREEYCLYFGNDESVQMDEYIARINQGFGAMFFHSSVEVASKMQLKAPKRWYMQIYDHRTQRSEIFPVLIKENWQHLPQIIKHVFMALGIDDNDLVIIHVRGNTHTITILYRPEYDTNRAFYENKLNKLKKYFQSLDDINEEIPFPE